MFWSILVFYSTELNFISRFSMTVRVNAVRNRTRFLLTVTNVSTTCSCAAVIFRVKVSCITSVCRWLLTWLVNEGALLLVVCQLSPDVKSDVWIQVVLQSSQLKTQRGHDVWKDLILRSLQSACYLPVLDLLSGTNKSCVQIFLLYLYTVFVLRALPCIGRQAGRQVRIRRVQHLATSKNFSCNQR